MWSDQPASLTLSPPPDHGAGHVVRIEGPDGDAVQFFASEDRAAALAFVLTASPEALRDRFLPPPPDGPSPSGD